MNLPMEQRIHEFHALGDLRKHFRRQHLELIKEEDRLGCELCEVLFEDMMHLQRHAIAVYSTVSYVYTSVIEFSCFEFKTEHISEVNQFCLFSVNESWWNTAAFSLEGCPLAARSVFRRNYVAST